MPTKVYSGTGYEEVGSYTFRPETRPYFVFLNLHKVQFKLLQKQQVHSFH